MDALACTPNYRSGTNIKIAAKRNCKNNTAKQHKKARLSCTKANLKMNIAILHVRHLKCLQCFDAVGWAAGRASGL